MHTVIRVWNQFFPRTGGGAGNANKIRNETTVTDSGRVGSEDLEDGRLDSSTDNDTLPFSTENDIRNVSVQRSSHPSAKLPYEMIAKIISYASEDVRIELPADLRNISPWNCARVCSSWKAVTDSMPDLWARIRVDFKKWSNYVGHVNLINSILFRHPQLSISLTIAPGRSRYYEAYAPINFITTHLLKVHSNRFRSLCFERGYHFGAFLAQPPGGVSSLETLRWTLDNKIDHVSVFRDAPSLRKVFIDLPTYSQIFFQLDLSRFALPWSQLTHIHFPGSLFTPTEAFMLLEMSSNLEDCCLGITTSETPGPAGPSDETISLTHPSLKTLTLVDRDLSSNGQRLSRITDLLKLLTLPNLINFKLSEECDIQYPSIRWDDMIFVEFIQRCSSLENLIVNEAVPSRYLEQILQNAPSLTKLSINYGDNFPATIVEQMLDPKFLPNLSVLKCCVFDLHVFLNMLESRWGVVSSPLREVCINVDSNGRGASDLSRRRIEALVEGGRNIILQG